MVSYAAPTHGASRPVSTGDRRNRSESGLILLELRAGLAKPEVREVPAPAAEDDHHEQRAADADRVEHSRTKDSRGPTLTRSGATFVPPSGDWRIAGRR